MTDTNPNDLLRAMFDAAVRAADPMRVVPQALPPRRPERLWVVGAGKASARMAEAVESVWGPCPGLVITRYGYARPCQGIEIVEAAHPVPDQAGVEGTKRILQSLEEMGQGDFVLSLISGGGSALLCAPAGRITLAEKQAVNAALLASGAPIGEMNVVRQQLSLVKGGQMAAAAWPARMLSLMISDVPGDDMALIASGPTVGTGGTAADAQRIITRYQIDVPRSVSDALAGPGSVVRPGDPRLAGVENRIVAAPMQSLQAAAKVAEAAGYRVEILSADLEGEARDLAVKQAHKAMKLQQEMPPGSQPVVLVSGGECTVTRRGSGVGGPNAEFVLAAALALDRKSGIHVLACDTDGVDGAAEVAGAIIGPDILKTARAGGVDAEKALQNNAAHDFFEATGGQVVTGPTLTNVNDFRAVLILPPA